MARGGAARRLGLLLLLLALCGRQQAVAAPVNAQPGSNAAAARLEALSGPWAPGFKKHVSDNTMVTVPINMNPQAKIPQSFLGLSFDTLNIQALGKRDYVNAVRILTRYNTGPMFIRVGAAAADHWEGTWPKAYWDSLRALYWGTPVKYILGVNFWSEKPDITKAQIADARKQLPSGGILSFAVGNEPDMYSLQPRNGQPGALNGGKPSGWLGAQWVPLSRSFFPAVGGGSKQLAGPDWSNTWMKPETLKWWLDNTYGSLNMVSLHHYGGNVFATGHVEELLAESNQKPKMDNLRRLVAVARDRNLPLRITESNTLSYGGVNGLCNTLGSAIWALDAALESAAAGAEGIHYHQVLADKGNANYNAIMYIKETDSVRVRMQFYGYLFFQMAVADSNVAILGGGPFWSGSRQCKAWPLRAGNGDLRVVVINKNDKQDCAVNILVDDKEMNNYSGDAAVDYMYGVEGLYTFWRAYVSNQHFELQGTALQGARTPGTAARYVNKNSAGRVNGAGWAVGMRQGTKALLVTIPRNGNRRVAG